MGPLVSVLFPVFNGEAYLKESLESILRQNHQDLEIIVINDGSTDRSAEILSQYRDPRIRLYHQTNQGLAASLNRAIGLANGEWLARQDQDDLSHPDRILKQLAFMQARPSCGLLGTWAQVWEGAQKTDRFLHHPTQNHILKFELLFDNYFVHSSVLIKRGILEKAGLYSTDKDRQPPEDYELWIRIAQHCEVANLDEELLIYREVPQSMSRTGLNPFLKRVIRLASENIFFLLKNEWAVDQCVELVKLFHHSYKDMDGRWSKREMTSLLDPLVDRVVTDRLQRKEVKEVAHERLFACWSEYVGSRGGQMRHTIQLAQTRLSRINAKP